MGRFGATSASWQAIRNIDLKGWKLSTQAGLCSLTFAAAPSDVNEVPHGLPPPVQIRHSEQSWQKFWPISLWLENMDFRGFQAFDATKTELTISYYTISERASFT